MVSFSLHPTKTDTERPGIELADIVRRFGPKYTAQYGHTTLPSQKRALSDIAACCTEQLGGRLYRCDDCRESFWRYHCCRNRACPKCHASRTGQWLEKREAELLPCGYFHAVATVPFELRDAFRREQKSMYGLLMRIAAEAVKELCAKKRHLGGLPGILSVLHTCNARLGYHPHVHMLITAGGITPDGEQWEPARGEYLVPVGLLSRKIAAEFRDALKKQDPELFASIPVGAWRREWVSFVKHYGNGNDAVLGYLSRYVFRTAISNSRILRMDDTHVTFRYKDRTADTWRTMRLPGVEFLQRFLTHVLPRGFHRVRYYGLWHHSKRKQASRAWQLLILQKPIGAVSPTKIADLLEALEQIEASGQLTHLNDDPYADENESEEGDGPDNPRCPHCGSVRTTLLGERPPPGTS
jgi:hypothetical protein